MKQKGFTLIELMIVVAIIGILAAVGIPRFAQMIEVSREGATKGNLSALRSAVSIYYSEKEGVWPSDLSNFTSYMAVIPPARAKPLGDSAVISVVSSTPSSAGIGWAYLQNGGLLWANSIATDVKGYSFTTY
jgi:prepilin-type N-terminal cleavage/methylation domain-containing protein